MLPVRLRSQLLRERRRGLGLSIAELSRRSGVDPHLLSNVESGKRGLGLSATVLVARCLDLKVEDMVEVGTDDQTPAGAAS